jgi:hypothetical protein
MYSVVSNGVRGEWTLSCEYTKRTFTRCLGCGSTRIALSSPSGIHTVEKNFLQNPFLYRFVKTDIKSQWIYEYRVDPVCTHRNAGCADNMDREMG